MINFNTIGRPEPGVVGGGTKKFYASIENDGELNLSDLTTSIEKICMVSGADSRAVLYTLVDVAIENLRSCDFFLSIILASNFMANKFQFHS